MRGIFPEMPPLLCRSLIASSPPLPARGLAEQHLGTREPYRLICRPRTGFTLPRYLTPKHNPSTHHLIPGPRRLSALAVDKRPQVGQVPVIRTMGKVRLSTGTMVGARLHPGSAPARAAQASRDRNLLMPSRLPSKPPILSAIEQHRIVIPRGFQSQNFAQHEPVIPGIDHGVDIAIDPGDGASDDRVAVV